MADNTIEQHDTERGMHEQLVKLDPPTDRSHVHEAAKSLLVNLGVSYLNATVGLDETTTPHTLRVYVYTKAVARRLRLRAPETWQGYAVLISYMGRPRPLGATV